MYLSTEAGRVLRHAITPMVILAVDRGWLPEAAQHDVVELSTIAATFIIVYGVSWWRDKQKGR
jgi:hypothetical protein